MRIVETQRSRQAGRRAGPAPRPIIVERPVFLIIVHPGQYPVADLAEISRPDRVGAKGPAFIGPELVAEFADAGIDLAVAIGIEQPARLMIFLAFLRINIAQPDIELQIVSRFDGQQRLRDIRLQPEKVTGLIMVPAPVGKKIALVVGRNAAQAVAAQIDIIASRLQRQRADTDIGCQTGVQDQRLIVRIPAGIIAVLVENRDTARQLLGKRPRGIYGTAKPATCASNGARFDRRVEGRFLRNIVEQAAGCGLAIEHPRRSLEKFHPLDIEGLGHRKTGIGEAARGDAGIAEHRDARYIAVEILRVAGALVANKIVGQNRDRLTGGQRIGRQLPRCRFLHAIQPLRPSDNDDVLPAFGISLCKVLRCKGGCCAEQHE